MKKPTERTPLNQARIAPAMLDEMEAMKRHLGFRRSLSLQQSMLAKQYRNLTKEEEEENNAPRNRFRIAAIMEAQDRWLSRSIKDIRERGEAEWTAKAVNGPFGDKTNTIVASKLHIPGDVSPDDLLPWLARYIREARKTAGIIPVQHPRRPEEDPWKVYDMMQEKNATLAAITEQVCKKPAYLPYGEGPSPAYRRVRTAYIFACEMIESIGAE